MIDRIPSGTRDVLPDEMRELRALTDRIHEVFATAGYGEVSTPSLEYEGTFNRSDTIGRPAYRVFDEQGNVLILRTDMTVPIARLVATRYSAAEPPLRFCYFAHAYRGVRPQRGQSREFLQAGIELIGVPGPQGTAEVLAVLCAALDAAGLRGYRVGVGDAALYPALLESLGRLARAAGADHRRTGPGRLRGRRARGARARPQRRRRRTAARRTPGAGRRRDPARPRRAAARRRGRHAGRCASGWPPRSPSGSSSTSASCARSATTRARCSRSTTPAYGVPIGSGGRYDELLGDLRPLAARGRLRAQRRAAAHRPDR